MKKILSILIIAFLLLLNTTYADFSIETTLSVQKQESLKKQIDSIYKIFENKLQKLNNDEQIKSLENITGKINNIVKTEKNNSNYFIFSYLNYLLKDKLDFIKNEIKNEKEYLEENKNPEYYNQEISTKTKILVKNIYKKSFTDKEKLEKLNDLYSNNNNSIDKEYINYYILEAKISILLNHQNFDEAKKITKDYFKLNNSYDVNKLNFIVKNSFYSSFGVLTQLISWLTPDNKSEFINLRNKFFPNESNSAYNIVRKSGYIQNDCEKLDIIDNNLDLIDKKFCKLFSGKFEIKDIEEVEELNNNIQNLSDKTNYYGYIGTYYPDLKEEMYTKNKKLGEIIIKNDENFINGYLALLVYFDYKNDCINFDKYSKLMFQNYVGDETRKKFLIERNYNNCSLNN